MTPDFQGFFFNRYILKFSVCSKISLLILRSLKSPVAQRISMLFAKINKVQTLPHAMEIVIFTASSRMGYFPAENAEIWRGQDQF